LILLIVIYSAVLLGIWKLGDQLVDATCGEDTGNKIINKDNLSGFYKFSNEIYGMMDDYYCTDACPCKVDAGTFDGADAN